MSVNEIIPEANEGLYKKASAAVEQWLELHKGETFDLDTICRQMEIHDAQKRHLIVKKLSYEVKAGRLEKSNRIYRYIDISIKNIDWVNAVEGDLLDITFPHSHDADDGNGVNTFFGFDGKVVVSPGDILIVAGVSNMGKTAICQNFLWDNMDKYPCTMMGNEITALKFKRRTSKMKWANPLKEDGTPKFELIERRDRWKDIIRPDNINIIDWISLPEKAYLIADVIDGIQSKLRKGIALLSIQKGEGRELGTGGQYSEHLSSLYLLVDFERLTVRKCKEWSGHNPNREVYRFKIVNGGTQFHDIHKVTKCAKCFATGKYRGGECDACNGLGYLDSGEE